MSKTDDYVKKFILEQESTLRELCTPLHTLGINGFSYSQVFTNGRFLTLTTNAKWAQHHFNSFFKEKYNREDILTTTFTDNEPQWIVNPASEIWQQAKSFEIDNSIILMKRQKNYAEIFCYTSSTKNYKTLDFYMNHQNLLHDFTFTFKDKTHRLIKSAAAQTLPTPKKYLVTPKTDAPNQTQNVRQQFYESITPQRIYIDDTKYLTAKEAECLKWCIQGKSAAEIGLILDITKRTVESHLDKIKLKLDCYKQTDLTRRAIELGIINLLMNT